MSISRNQRNGIVIASAAGLLLLLMAMVLGPLVNSATADSGVSATADCRVAAAHYVQLAKGFTPDQYVVGKIDSDLPGASANRGDSFSSKPVTTKKELRKQLTSGSPEAEAVIADVQQQIKGKGPSAAEVQDTDNWVSVQYMVAVVWPENTTFVGGQEQPAGQLDNGQIGEVSWIFVSKAGCELAKVKKVNVAKVVEQTASKRGACLNGSSHPVPAPPSTPTTPSTPGTTVPVTPEQPNPTPGEKPVTPDKPCVKPAKPGDGNYTYNPETCVWKKVAQTFDEMQGPDTGVFQPPQDNSTSGAYTGPTIDTSTGKAIVEPPVQEATPNNNRDDSSPAPPPTTTGTNSGAADGSGTPSGSTTDSAGTTVGGTVTNTPDDSQADAAGDDNSGMPTSP